MSQVQQSMNLLPEYMENYIKDLLSNIYNVDEETGAVTGLASKSPLEGTPLFQVDEEGNQVLDAEGNPIPIYETDEEGNPILDQYGNKVQKFEGGVPKPDIIRFTDPQIKALEMITGKFDEEGNIIEGTGGIGAYKDYYDKASKFLDQASLALDPTATTPMFDAQGNPGYHA